MIEVNAPNDYPCNRYNVFLAGSIDNGSAENWQAKVCKELSDLDITVLNPRRETSPAKTNLASDPDFYEQVMWELKALDAADLIVMYFDPWSQAPISLLELGLYHKKPMIVCCPDGFWRQGNVEIVCQKHRIPLNKNYDSFMRAIKGMISFDLIDKSFMNTKSRDNHELLMSSLNGIGESLDRLRPGNVAHQTAHMRSLLNQSMELITRINERREIDEVCCEEA